MILFQQSCRATFFGLLGFHVVKRLPIMMHFFLIGVMIFTTGEGKKISSSWDVKNLRFPDPNRQYRVRHGIATIESEYLGINMSILVLKHQNYKKTTFFHQFLTISTLSIVALPCRTYVYTWMLIHIQWVGVRVPLLWAVGEPAAGWLRIMPLIALVRTVAFLLPSITAPFQRHASLLFSRELLQNVWKLYFQRRGRKNKIPKEKEKPPISGGPH